MKYLLFSLFIGTNLFAATHDVTVSSNIFTPANIQIQAGDTVRWTNIGGGHNVRAEDNSFRCAQGCESEGGNGDASTALWVSEVTFRKIGFTSYICEPHVGFGMRGSVTVVEPTSVPVHQLASTINEGFDPNELTIQVGDIVRIQNQGAPHNFNALDNSLICSEGCEGDGTNTTSNPTAFAWDIFVRFDEVKDIPYFCAQHPTDTGIIRIIADSLFVNGFE